MDKMDYVYASICLPQWFEPAVHKFNQCPEGRIELVNAERGTLFGDRKPRTYLLAEFTLEDLSIGLVLSGFVERGQKPEEKAIAEVIAQFKEDCDQPIYDFEGSILAWMRSYLQFGIEPRIGIEKVDGFFRIYDPTIDRPPGSQGLYERKQLCHSIPSELLTKRVREAICMNHIPEEHGFRYQTGDSLTKVMCMTLGLLELLQPLRTKREKAWKPPII